MAFQIKLQKFTLSLFFFLLEYMQLLGLGFQTKSAETCLNKIAPWNEF